MSADPFLSPHQLRRRFSAAMSQMYRQEVPAYGTLMELVSEVNAARLSQDPDLKATLAATDGLDRLSQERHGAIRVGTAAELRQLGRLFRVLGMHPVGYYDLSVAGIPVHSTAFRPLEASALAQNPFRVFTSLLRLELIADRELRRSAEAVLAQRTIFTEQALALTAQAEAEGGLSAADGERFIAEALETFRWHPQACVTDDLYRRLHSAHRLIADVVSFRGPHINHLTPRTLDIDRVQALMPERGITPKAVVEGPPPRRCPILLRQTSFKALEEPVQFKTAAGGWVAGKHTARFGEIEQRGAALTPKGRALYDDLLAQARAAVTPSADGGNADEYSATLVKIFSDFPDDWETLRRDELAYFSYRLTAQGEERVSSGERISGDLDALIAQGHLAVAPLIYEDFLPVSAAGIFQSNLGDHAAQRFGASANREAFEEALEMSLADEFEHYRQVEAQSIERCFKLLRRI